MARTANFAYQDPTAAIGNSLAKAIFGDPGAAAEQAKARAEIELRAAQAERERAAAGYENSRTVEQSSQSAAADSTSGIYDKYFGPQPQAQPTMPVPMWGAAPEVNEAPMQVAPPAPLAVEARQREGMAQTILALARARGSSVDIGETIGSLASFLGGDEMARRGLVAQGHSPTADFAITRARADEVASRDAAAEQSLAEAVATINNRDDVPVANVNARARRYAADQSAGASNFATSTRSDTSRYATDARAATARDAAERKEAERAATRRSKPISVASFKRLDKAVADQLAARGLQSPPSEDGTPGASRLDRGVNTWIRTRAIENFRASGNLLDAAEKAIGAAMAASNRQKAERAARTAPAAVRGHGAVGKRLTVEQAAKLPRGTRFVGMDGVARWRQ